MKRNTNAILVSNFHIFSACHVSNASLFQDLSDDDIEEVETFVRERLLTILKSRKNFEQTGNNMIKYFSNEFASCPDHFQFQIGDKLNEFMSKQSTKSTEKISDDAARTFFFLNKLQAATNQNSNRKKGGYTARKCTDT